MDDGCFEVPDGSEILHVKVDPVPLQVKAQCTFCGEYMTVMGNSEEAIVGRYQEIMQYCKPCDCLRKMKKAGWVSGL